jgi:four helix bundle protein
MDVVEMVYELTRSYPAEEKFGLASQLQRAAVSIPSNIAEGHAREHRGEHIHHLSFAQASLAEVETQVEIAVRLNYVSSEPALILRDTLDSLGKQLRALRKALS